MSFLTAMTTAASYASYSTSSSDGPSAILVIFVLAIGVASIVANFKLFAMAGEPAWACIIPIYGTVVLFRIIYGSGWKWLLLFVPILGEALAIVMYFRLAQVFGRSTAFGLGMILLTPIFWLLLAYDGKSRYIGARTDVFI